MGRNDDALGGEWIIPKGWTAGSVMLQVVWPPPWSSALSGLLKQASWCGDLCAWKPLAQVGGFWVDFQVVFSTGACIRLENFQDKWLDSEKTQLKVEIFCGSYF